MPIDMLIYICIWMIWIMDYSRHSKCKFGTRVPFNHILVIAEIIMPLTLFACFIESKYFVLYL